MTTNESMPKIQAIPAGKQKYTKKFEILYSVHDVTTNTTLGWYEKVYLTDDDTVDTFLRKIEDGKRNYKNDPRVTIQITKLKI